MDLISEEAQDLDQLSNDINSNVVGHIYSPRALSNQAETASSPELDPATATCTKLMINNITPASCTPAGINTTSNKKR